MKSLKMFCNDVTWHFLFFFLLFKYIVFDKHILIKFKVNIYKNSIVFHINFFSDNSLKMIFVKQYYFCLSLSLVYDKNVTIEIKIRK